MKSVHIGLAAMVFCATLIAQPADATPLLSGPIVNAANGHTYYLLSADTWTNSEATAVSMGGHLATVRNMQEDMWIYDTFSTFGGINRALWIGLTDQNAGGVWDASLGHQTGTFSWTSGEAVTFTNWSAGQPNNVWNTSVPTENWAHMWAPGGYGAAPDGSWNDYVNSPSLDGVAPLNGVIEVWASDTGAAVPEPSTLALFGFGLLGLMAFMRSRKTA